MDDTIARIEAEVAMLLRLADRNRRTGDALEGTLDRSAYLLLGRLATDGATNVNTLAGRLCLDPSTVTRQVLAMEADALVLRGRDPQDGRATLVTATDRGRAELAATRAARAALYAEMLAAWSPDDRTRMAELLARLNADLDARVRGA
jgi:DNA-binding MarR family transcriptional regulator